MTVITINEFRKVVELSMKCEKCGAELSAQAKSCPNCNSPVAAKQINNINTTKKNIPSGNGNAQSNTNKSGEQAVDKDFDRQYSLMFENDTQVVGDLGYEVDESLKKKREAHYDDSFANMTDDEKIKALEAARLARKERREKKQVKKSEGGLFNFNKDNDQEAADKPKRESVSSTSSLDKKDETAQRPAAVHERKREAAKPRRHMKKLSPKTGLIAGAIIAVVVIGIVIASVNMASKVTGSIPATPTVYAKDNNLYSYYNGKQVELAQNFIASEYSEPTEPTATPNRNRDDDEPTSTPASVYEPIKEKELINYTESGTGTYFISAADLNKNSGKLQFSQNGNKNGTVSISDDVYYDIEITDDGTGVLYLSGTDQFGNGGSLNYWSNVTKKSEKLSDNVLPGNYRFGQGGNSVIYVTEYNSEHFVGDLYLKEITKGAVTQTKKVDSDVYMAFGTNPSGKAVVYAKNYNTENECFDIYLLKENTDESVLVTDGSRIEPLFLKSTDGMYIGGSYQDYYQSLYYASLASGEKEKIASGLTEMVKMSKDEQAVVFRKANAEGTAFEYYYAHQAGTEGQVLAKDITVLDDEEHKRVSQFEINDDFTKVAFIQGYDVAVESGGLYLLSITNGVVGSDKKISDTAYSCNITADGQTVRYADSYDITWNLVSLNAYTGDQNKVLAKEVGAGAFTFDKTGNYIVYAKNYSLETRTGDVFCVDNKGKTVEVVKGVSSYGLKNNGEIVYYNNKDDNSGFDLFFTREDGKKSKSIDKGVTKVVSY